MKRFVTHLSISMALLAVCAGAGAEDMPTYTGNVVNITPGMSIQAAVDVAQPGDVITLAPGTYYESVVVSQSGTAAEPIVIIAEDPGTATISGATPPGFNLVFTQVSGDLYSAPVPWTVRWVMADGRNLMGYNDLAGLTSFTTIGHDTGQYVDGAPEGFVWVNGTLYIRLLDAQDPNAAGVEIHRQVALWETSDTNTQFFGTRAWPSIRDHDLDDPVGANVTITGSHVILAGLKLHLGPLVAVNVAADDVKIHDCYIDGAWRSIRAGGSARVTVEHNEFSGYPSYQWVRWGYVNGQQWDLWNAIYNTNLNINHVQHYGESFQLKNNYVYECFDCIWPRDMGSLDPADTSEYGHNTVMSCGDECIEFDTMQAINLRVHHNFFMDATALLALSPVQGGGLMIDHNIAYSSPEYGLGSSVIFKFDCPWCGNFPGPTQLVTIAHNTLVSATGGLYWTGENRSYQNSIAENNIFYTYRESGWVHPDFTLSAYNLHSGPRMEPNAAFMSHLIHAADPDLVSSPSIARGAMVNGSLTQLPVLPLQNGPIQTEDPMPDFRLQAGGISVDAGNPALYLDDDYHHVRAGAAPDAGAIELGEEWEMATGPRWAVGAKTPWRPTPPPSLDPSWLGVQPVPEPGSLAGMLAGLVLLALMKRRREVRG